MKTQTAIFAERLKDLRKTFGLTQAELSKKLGLGRTAVSNYETERTMPDPITLSELSKLFNVSVDYLLGSEETNNSFTTASPLKKKKQTDDEKLQEFLETARIHFMDAKEEDQDKIMKCLQDVFWETKEINRKKYNPNKNKPNNN